MDRFAEREKLQDQLRGLEAALRAADEGLRHITEYKSETSAAAYTREQEPMFSRTPSLNFEVRTNFVLTLTFSELFL